MRTEIGKIKSIRIGSGGYDDAMFGVSFTLGSDKGCWGVHDFWGTWSSPPSERAEWTVDDQVKTFQETIIKLKDLMESAKVKDANALVGTPVEATFDDKRTLKSWRILEEVI